MLLGCENFRQTWFDIRPSIRCSNDLRSALASINTNIILIGAENMYGNDSDMETCRYVSQISMELFNLKNALKFEMFQKDMCSLVLDDYAIGMEKLEIQVQTERNENILPCFNSNQLRWSQCFGVHKNESEHMKTQENSGHTDYYRFGKLVKCQNDSNTILVWIETNRKKWRSSQFIDRYGTLRDIQKWTRRNQRKVIWLESLIKNRNL